MSQVTGSGYKLNNDLSEVIESLILQYNKFLTKDGIPPESRSAAKLMTTTLLSYAQKVPIVNRLLPSLDGKQQLINSLMNQQKIATTYQKWYDISSQLDELLGKNEWKNELQSDLYDYEQILENLNEMKAARETQDYKLLLYLIRTKWVRNFGNMGDVSLYKHSLVGTKKLVEDYINECKTSLDYLVNHPSVQLDDRYLLGLLIQTRKNIGRTALVLSGGSTFGMFHIGVLVSLLEANLLPRIISGSSAGSIVASILCCHNNEENKTLIESLSGQEFEIFSNNEEGDTDKDNKPQNKFRRLLKCVGHFLKYGTVFESEGLKQTIMGFIGDLTFREAYNRTGKILNITVSPASLHEQTRLLNYLTAPNCLIWSAVCASCSLPGIFPSTSIYEKNPRTNKVQKWNGDSSVKFVDGSVDNDLPVTRLSEMFNVDHIIAVQVNPHVVPILKVSVSNSGGYLENDFTTKVKHALNNVYDFCTSEMIHYLSILNEMDIYKNLSTKLISLLSQKYSGDITILLQFSASDFNKIFVNPTPEFIADFIIRGARSTWPKITIINNHCGVEFELDKAISILRGRTISSTDKSTFANSLVINPISYTSGSSPQKSLAGQEEKEVKGSKENEKPVLQETNVNKGPEAKKEVMTPDRKFTPLTPHKSAPKFQRHNSGSASASASASHSVHRKRNSISNFQAFRKSNTSLASMSSSPTTPMKKEQTRNRAQSDQQVGKNKIRKARSSGNFNFEDEPDNSPTNQRLRYQADRIPWDENPYADQHSSQTIASDEENIDSGSEKGTEGGENPEIEIFTGGQDKEQDQKNATSTPIGEKRSSTYGNIISSSREDKAIIKTVGFSFNGTEDNSRRNSFGRSGLYDEDDDGVEEANVSNFGESSTASDADSQGRKEEKANLPKRSLNNSSTNSYIGLNRLKDANFTSNKAHSQEVKTALNRVNNEHQ